MLRPPRAKGGARGGLRDERDDARARRDLDRCCVEGARPVPRPRGVRERFSSVDSSGAGDVELCLFSVDLDVGSTVVDLGERVEAARVREREREARGDTAARTLR